MDNNVNFTGGFLLKMPKAKQWNKIKEVLPNKQVQIDNLYRRGNIFFSVPNCYDKKVGNYILGQNVDFVYYPSVNTKSRLDPYHPEEAEKFLNAQTDTIRDTDRLKNIFKLVQDILYKPIKSYKWVNNDHIEQTTTALGLDLQHVKVSVKNNVTIIEDKESGRLIAKASPNNHDGINFALVYPENPNQTLRMVAINHLGEIQTSTTNPDNMPKFIEQFKKAINVHKGRKHPLVV